MKKIYMKLVGRCSIHGMNHFGGSNKGQPYKFKSRQRYICCVASELIYIRKKHKKIYRRKARRKNWELP